MLELDVRADLCLAILIWLVQTLVKSGEAQDFK
jgi:hypothetical protein